MRIRLGVNENRLGVNENPDAPQIVRQDISPPLRGGNRAGLVAAIVVPLEAQQASKPDTGGRLRRLAKNGYKVPLTKAVVKRTIAAIAV
jgi:hypothetical protein